MEILPDRPVDFLLVTALPEEREAVLSKLPGNKRLPHVKGTVRVFYQADLPVTFSDGMRGSYRLIVMDLLGMGRPQAAAATTEAIHLWHPRYIVLVGIAGGVKERDVGLGDILIADQIVDYQQQKATSQGSQVRWDVYRVDPGLFDACSNFQDEKWVEPIAAVRPEPGKPNRHTGPIASGDTVIAFSEVLKKYQNVWTKLIGVEMEAAGVAMAAFQSQDKPGFFMVRGVSDLADENKGSAGVDKWRSYACEAAAAFTMAFLKSGPVPVRKRLTRRAVILLGFLGLVSILIFSGIWANREALLAPWLGKTSTSVSSITSTLTLFPTLTFTPTHLPTSTRVVIIPSTPIPCICQSSTDYETMTCLINKESEAANLGSLELIALIYAPNATIFRGDTKQTWIDPLSYYRPTFGALAFSDATHFDLNQVKMIGQTAYWVSGSNGKYTTSSGISTPYNNASPSEHWIFQKNQKGCWVITRFEFNASTFPFPP